MFKLILPGCVPYLYFTEIHIPGSALNPQHFQNAITINHFILQGVSMVYNYVTGAIICSFKLKRKFSHHGLRVLFLSKAGFFFPGGTGGSPHPAKILSFPTL